MNWATNHRRRKEKLGQLGDNPKDPEAETVKREGEAPAEPEANRHFRLGRSLALPLSQSDSQSISPLREAAQKNRGRAG